MLCFLCSFHHKKGIFVTPTTMYNCTCMKHQVPVVRVVISSLLMKGLLLAQTSYHHAHMVIKVVLKLTVESLFSLCKVCSKAMESHCEMLDLNSAVFYLIKTEHFFCTELLITVVLS